MRLLPKDETFWNFFHEQTAALSSATDLLRRSVKEGNSGLAGAAIRIKAIERESASKLHDLQIRLHKTFVTPIDPEDISLLFEELDRLLDILEGISYRLTTHNFDPLPAMMSELAERVHSSSELIERAFGLLSIGDSTEGLCKQMIEIQEQTSLSLRECVTRLFTEEKDAIALLKKKDIYDIFDRLSEATQHLANSLQNVSIKNS